MQFITEIETEKYKDTRIPETPKEDENKEDGVEIKLKTCNL
jgi:hypothetical protein